MKSIAVRGMLQGEYGGRGVSEPSETPQQSLLSVVPIQGTSWLFLGGDVAGGTSAKPALQEAESLLFDMTREQVIWRGKLLLRI